MAAKPANVGIVHDEEQNGKRKLHCPICNDVMVTLTKQRHSSRDALNDIFGVPNDIWDAEENAHASGGDYGVDWRVLVSNHIKSHSPDAVTKRIRDLEQAVAGWRRSAELYADMLEGMARSSDLQRNVDFREWLIGYYDDFKNVFPSELLPLLQGKVSPSAGR